MGSGCWGHIGHVAFNSIRRLLWAFIRQRQQQKMVSGHTVWAFPCLGLPSCILPYTVDETRLEIETKVQRWRGGASCI